MNIQHAELPFEGGTVRLEYAWLNADRAEAPPIVFLHEGLGTLAMWRDFPQRLCDAGGFRGLLYSRSGYGRSTARRPREQWPLDYLEREARQLLPDFLRAVGVAARPWLFGHSDGASIALIYAAAFPEALAGAMALAPHIFVEDATIAGIAAARRGGATRPPTCGSDWGAITRIRMARSGAGTTAGSIRRSAIGASNRCCRRSAARCWRSKARTTSTRPWPNLTASSGRCRRPNC